MTWIQERLTEAHSRRRIVRYVRSRLDEEGIASHGYVVGHSHSWLLTHYVGDALGLDGYDAVRMADLTEVTFDGPETRFLERCVTLKQQVALAPAGIDLASTKALLESVARAFPLLMIHREHLLPDRCEVGQLKLVGRDAYTLRWLTPQATWSDDDGIYRFEDVTRLTFASEYDLTLAALAEGLEWPVQPGSAPRPGEPLEGR